MITKLMISICAETDRDALRVMHRLREMMDVASGSDCGIHLNDAGYVSGHEGGNGVASVFHIPGEMRIDSGLGACPFCRCDGHAWVDQLSADEWVVKCNVCGAEGSACGDEELAREYWLRTAELVKKGES